METVFKVGMKVWDKTISPDKGKVIEVLKDTRYDFPIKVEFNDGLKIKYTNEGCFVKSKGAINTLSTVDYSIELEGFEQKAPTRTYEEAVEWLESTEGTNIMNDSVFLTEGNYYTNLNECTEALKKLIVLRDYYNEGWQPDWEDDEWKYFIEYYRGKLDVERTCGNGRVLAFKSKEIRDKFLEDQRELLEIAKPLL